MNTKICINIEIPNKKSIYNKIVLMKVIKLTESDLIRIVNKVILREQDEEPEKEQNLLIALRNLAKGKIDKNELYRIDDTIEEIRVKNPLGQSLITIKLGDKDDFLEKIGLSEDDVWFRRILFGYDGYDFVDSYQILEDFKEGYIFEYELNEENLDALKSIALSILPYEEFNIQDDDYKRKLHELLLEIFPKEIDYILGDYAAEKNYEMNAVAKESINKEFDDKISESGVDLSYDMDEATITLADLFSEALQLNLFTSNAKDMVTEIISRKLGNVGGWYESSYKFTDSENFDKESFNRYVSQQFEKILEKIDEESESEYTVKDYIEFIKRVTSKFKLKTWYTTPKDENIRFSIEHFEPETMKMVISLNNKKTGEIFGTKMSEEDFNQFLYQPTLFNLEDMY